MNGTDTASPATPRVLVVEDDAPLAAGIAENLRAEGYETHVLHDGKAAVDRLVAETYDLVVLDVMLPGCDGFEVCRSLRARGRVMPVMFLTARGDPEDRVRGLEAGGDDYLTKPFQLREFLLRTRAILRRWQWYRGEGAAREPPLAFGGNRIDFGQFRGTAWDGVLHDLTEKEAMILKALAEAAGRVVSREDLVERVWGEDVFPSTRTVDNFILRLRKRFERDPPNPRFFHSVRGVGYRFDPDGSTE